MCKHNSILTEETCSFCQEEKKEQSSGYEIPEDERPDAPIFEGMDDIDEEAARIGRGTKGFRFRDASRRGAKGYRNR